jgi:hypothetical protein
MKRTKNDRSDGNRQLTAEELKRVSGGGLQPASGGTSGGPTSLVDGGGPGSGGSGTGPS